MIDELSRNIAANRKRLGLTQDELSKRLGVSYQAVSKWENAQTMPDIALLPGLAAALQTDINGLMGYSHSRRQITYYEDQYGGDGYYWGVEPSTMCYEVMKRCPPTAPKRVLDIGCGEGKDAVFFARNGYRVDAFDITADGVSKTRRLAEQCHVFVNAFQADLLDYRLEHQYDIIFSSGVFHYIPEGIRRELIGHYQAHTVESGIHAINVFVKKPFIADPPEREENATVWRSGELATLYADWWIDEMSEMIFDCDSSGIAHRHCMDRVIARKVVET